METGTPPSIPWAKLTDNPANEAAGWNFLQDGRVQWPVDGSRWLFDHVWADPRRQRQFVSSGGVITRQTRELTRQGVTVRLRPLGERMEKDSSGRRC
jgi:hypothetical protein